MPTPALAVPYEAPSVLNMMAAAQPRALKKGYGNYVSQSFHLGLFGLRTAYIGLCELVLAVMLFWGVQSLLTRCLMGTWCFEIV